MTFDREPGLTPVFTLVVWATSLAVGVGGLVAGYPRPAAPAPPLSPVQATLINVQVTQDAMPPPQGGPPEEAAAPAPALQAAPPPPAPEAMTAPQAMPLTPVAVAAPAMVIPVKAPPPVTAPVKRSPPVAKAPQVTQLTYGRGEGRQPAPEYPREAALAGQEGTIGIRFTVAEDGSVLTVDISSPCAWPLLNQAAARAVRESWRFESGRPRTFQVSIRFQLKH